MKTIAPIIQQQEITTECNNACKFCYNPERCQNEFELRTDDAKRNIQIAEISVQKGVMAACLTGGEPLLVKNNLYDILKIYQQTGCYTSINSNGRLITGSVAKKLFALGLKSALISIHGVDSLHDQMVGDKNAFSQTWQGLVNLRENNISVTPNFVATAQNIYGLLAVGERLAKHGFKSMAVTPFLPSWQAKNHQEFVLAKKHYQHYFLTVNKVRSMGVKIDSTLPISPCVLIKFFPDNWQDFLDVHSSRVCMAGRSFGVVSPDGLFRSCIQAPYLSEFGDNMLDNYEQSWTKAGDWASKSFIPDKCSQCFALSVCGAGCRTSCLWVNSGSVKGQTMYMGEPLTVEQSRHFISRIEFDVKNSQYFKWRKNIKFREEKNGLIVFNPANQSFTILSEVAKRTVKNDVVKFYSAKAANVLMSIGAVRSVDYHHQNQIFIDHSKVLPGKVLLPRLSNNLVDQDKVYCLRADTGERYFF